MHTHISNGNNNVMFKSTADSRADAERRTGDPSCHPPNVLLGDECDTKDFASDQVGAPDVPAGSYPAGVISPFTYSVVTLRGEGFSRLQDGDRVWFFRDCRRPLYNLPLGKFRKTKARGSNRRIRKGCLGRRRPNSFFKAFLFWHRRQREDHPLCDRHRQGEGWQKRVIGRRGRVPTCLSDRLHKGSRSLDVTPPKVHKFDQFCNLS